MFREVGHFAPVIVLLLTVLLTRLLPRGTMKVVCIVWLLLVIGVSFAKYQTKTQSLDFAASRQLFAEFKTFDDTHKSKDERVLAYPFFEQYSFTPFPIQFQDNLPLQNVGHDNFSTYSDKQFVKNAIKPQDFKLSLHYRLLKTLDVDILKPYNIRYIYDFSAFYQSYYDRYVPSGTYDGELGWIKNRPGFMDELISQNPGKLKRVSPHILEVTNYMPRVSAADKLYSVASSQEGDAAAQFMEKVFPGQQYSYVDRSVSSVPAGSGQITSLFADARPDMINSENRSLTQKLNLKADTKVYSNNTPSVVTYEAHGGVATFYAANSGKLYANDKLVLDNDTAGRRTLGTVKMPAGQDFLIGLEGDIMPLKRDGSAVIGHLSGGSLLELFAATDGNMISNPSFESGLWGQTVGDCNNYDDKPDIAQHQDGSTASDGTRSLELSARRHDACSSTNFDLKADTTYLLSYDYQSPNTDTASFYLRFNDSDESAIKRFQSIADDRWHTATQPIVTPSGTTKGQLFVHALASGKDQPAINRYDNIRLLELQKVGETAIDIPEATYSMQDLDSSGETAFRFVDPSYDFANAFMNGSFENGPWRPKVTDCNSYDKSPNIAMSIDKDSKTDGKQSLRLDATKHAACTYTNVNVRAGTDYILSFDYQSNNPSAQLGYYAEFNGGDSGNQQRITPTDRAWHTYTTKIHVPALTPSMQFYLHAYEDNGIATNTVRFDNIKLTAIPALDQQFYAVTEPQTNLSKPRDIQFHTDSETHRAVKVTEARGPFVVLLSETYHPGWRLELDDAGAHSWLPNASVRTTADHFESSGYANGWYVDPGKICSGNATGCVRHEDGSYDIALVAEFVPQRWFGINRFVSVATLLGIVVYLAVTHDWRRKEVEDGVYQHPLVRRRRR